MVEYFTKRAVNTGKMIKCCFPAFSSFSINTLPYKKILDWSKLKAFADEKINVG